MPLPAYAQTRLFRDFCAFSRAHIESGDIDPSYPVLHVAFDLMDITYEQCIWYTALYVAVYDLGVAYDLWRKYPTPTDNIHIVNPKTGIERRGMRGNDNATTNIRALLELADGNLVGWLNTCVEGDTREDAWRNVREQFERIPYNGSWASYKWADLVKHTLAQDIDAPDIGVGGKGKNAGPIPGMVRLTGYDWKECANAIGLQRELLDACLQSNVPFSGLEQLETSLCDFNSLAKGRYYVGHDIDSMMTHLPKHATELWQARMEIFAPRFLGEVNGWVGVRKDLKALYKNKGILYI